MDDIKEDVRNRYAKAALEVLRGNTEFRCGCGTCAGGDPGPVTRNLYGGGETAALPEAAVLASLGCGNPTALTELRSGDVVLDLGSGGGIDVLLSARRVGPTGKVYGLDMTDEMLALALENAAKAGVENVEFLRGEIESIPLPDESVDVIISNCVINLSADKVAVLREAFRVLRPGGRFAVSDIVTEGDIPPDVRRSVELWVGCVAGALAADEFRRLLESAGFVDVGIEATRVYRAEDAHPLFEAASIDFEAVAPLVDGKFTAAFIRGRKPGSDSESGRSE